MLLGNLANLYIRIGLFDEARDINSKAIAIAESGNLERFPELWGMRSNIYEHTNQPDSAHLRTLGLIVSEGKMIDASFVVCNIARLCQIKRYHPQWIAV